MKNKLDPRQYTPYSLNTPSGNLFFVQNIASFSCYLLEKQSGNFQFTGEYLRFNGGNIISTDPSNDVGATNEVINSINCFATGSSNTIIGSDSSEISGSNNLILGGSDNQVISADYASVIFGRNTIVRHTGAAILGDGDNSRQKNSTAQNSLTIDFSSGLFINNDASFNGDVYLTGGNVFIDQGSLNINENFSGLFSGDIQVLGTAYHTGSPLQSLQNLLDQSGSLRNLIFNTSGVLRTGINDLSGVLDTRIFNTGYSLIQNISTVSGNLKDEINLSLENRVSTTGQNTINGLKTFQSGITFNGPISGGNAQFTGNLVLGNGRFIPNVFNASGISGQISFDTRYAYFCTGTNAWARMLITGW